MASIDQEKAAFSDLTQSLDVGTWRLRPLASSDAPDLLRHFGRDDVTEFMDIDALKTLDEAMEIVLWAEDLRARAVGVRWSIRDREDGAFVGTCGFNSIVRAHGRRAEIAYDLYPDYWGQGIMKLVVRRLLDLADQGLNLKRVEAMVTPGNERSCRLLESCGFEREGRLKKYGYWKGAFWDQLIFGHVVGC